MPRESRKLTPEQVKAAADRAEGIAADDADTPVLGRPTDYKPEFVEQVAKLCELGAKDIEIADFFGVSVATLFRWTQKYPDFCEARRLAKDIADTRVERSLYHRAIGYEFDSEEVFQYKGEIVRAKVRRHVPPDTSSMIFWLKNRKSDKWRDVQKVEHGLPGDFDRLSDQELLEELRKDSSELGVTIEHEPLAIEAKANGKTQH